jgi:putative transposase
MRMARPIRIEYPGAMYHVMCRGNNGRDVFFGEDGCKKFLDTLDEACMRAGWFVHAYVLMGNHYHLLLETPEGNLVDGMKWFQGTYTQRINAWQGRRGHLFQGRYKAQLINSEQRDDNYFQTVSEYIHLNPARARMTGEGKRWERLRDYPWSSVQLYCGGKRKRPSWLASQTLVGTEWIAQMLWMGHRSNVSAAKKWVRETKEGRKWLRKLW